MCTATPRSIAISLSGGVDSMVLATMLKHMAPTFNNFDVVAMHIDYSNRPESAAEAAFVEDWCRRHGGGLYKLNPAEYILILLNPVYPQFNPV